MRWGALMRALWRHSRDFDLVHIHTPFIAHYAGVRCARRLRDSLHRDLSHFLRGISASLRAAAAALARPRPRARLHPLAVPGGSALIAPSEPMRDGAARLRCDDADPCDSHRARAAKRFKRGRRCALSRRARRAGRSAARCSTSAAWRTRRTSIFCCRYSHACARACPSAICSSSPAKVPARDSLRAACRHASGLPAQCISSATLIATRELLDCYAAADVFVFASRTETQGLVLLEAMAQGAPLVSTAHLGTRSVLKEGCGALIVAGGSSSRSRRRSVRVLEDAGAACTACRGGPALRDRVVIACHGTAPAGAVPRDGSRRRAARHRRRNILPRALTNSAS